MHPSVATSTTPPAVVRSDLRGDLARAAGAWRRYPLLPLATVVVSSFVCLSNGSGGLAMIVALGALLLVGWPGTERLFYLRAWHGDGLRLRDLPAVTLRFFRRFFVLGLLALAAFVVLALPALSELARLAAEAARSAVAAGGTDPAQLDLDVPVWVTLWMIAVLVLLDMLGTFVTPALVYSTWRVGEALRTGLRMLLRTWPRAALYVVLPPVAVVVVNLFAQPGRVTGTLAVGAAALLNLLVKGAVASYYLRAVGPVPPEGAMKPPAHPASSGGWDGAPGWTDHR